MEIESTAKEKYGQFLNNGGMVLEVGSGNEINLETLWVAC